ncbi:MAG: diadenosine tetraphosphate hydrolase [Phenylobacterium zucineum]|nr:MAG: diadenosine tetraphosphate hydrolase [Phenylobacterium zucineum]
MFELHPAFPPTSEAVGELSLCHVRLQADARYPWIVLIPRFPGLREIDDLSPAHRVRLMEEIVVAGEAVRALGEAQGRPVEKLNVGALGNMTPQLHVHVVGRRADDAAWPGPVWGFGAAEAYADDRLAAALATVRRALGLG